MALDIYLGKEINNNSSVIFKENDRLLNSFVLGATRSGIKKFLLNQITQDIERFKNQDALLKNGLTVVDSTGDLKGIFKRCTVCR